VRKILAFTAVSMLLLLGACKSSGDSGSTGGTTGGSTVAADPRAPGVTDDSIKVGITYPDLAAIRDVIQRDHGSYEAAFQAEIDHINAGGGIQGRKLETVFAPVNPVGAAPADAACTKLTQDDQVFVAMGYFQSDNVLCYVDTNETAVVGGEMTAERLAQAKAPWFTVEPGEDLQGDVVRAMAEKGDLDGKVAVVVTAADKQLVDQAITPLLEEKNVDVVETGVIDAPPTDTAATNAAAQAIAERFKAAGADKVLVVGTGGPQSFAPGLARTDYRPELLFTSLNAVKSYANGPESDVTVLDGAKAGGLYDPPADRIKLPGVTQECVQRQVTANGLDPNVDPDSLPKEARNPWVSSAAACNQVALLAAILEKAGPELNYGTFREAGDTLGTVNQPTFPDGTYTFGPPPSADGDPTAYVFVYQSASNAWERRDS